MSSLVDTLAPEITEFVTDLKVFATGSYLRPEERELWDAPFAASAVDEVQVILDQFAHTLGAAESAEAAHAAVMASIDELVALNDAHFDAIFDEDEYTDIAAIMNLGLSAQGFTELRVGLEHFEGIDLGDEGAES